MQIRMEGLGFFVLPEVSSVGITHKWRELDLKPKFDVSFSSNIDERAVYVIAPPPTTFPNYFGSLVSFSNVLYVIFTIVQVH